MATIEDVQRYAGAVFSITRQHHLPEFQPPTYHWELMLSGRLVACGFTLDYLTAQRRVCENFSRFALRDAAPEA